MRKLFLIALLVAFPAAAEAQITLQQARDEAHAWIVARKDAIIARVQACVDEGDPRLCHTAWAASAMCNTLPTDSQLCTITLDDPGRYVTGPCDSCFTGEGQFADAGISIPATAPVNAKLNIFKRAVSWKDGVQLVVRFMYDGTIQERAYGTGIAPSYGWREMTAGS
jgi:hypothetical protein